MTQNMSLGKHLTAMLILGMSLACGCYCEESRDCPDWDYHAHARKWATKMNLDASSVDCIKLSYCVARCAVAYDTGGDPGRTLVEVRCARRYAPSCVLLPPK
jgi:hypothetical protein